MPPCKTASWRLLRAGFLYRSQSLLDIAVIRIQVERDSQLLFRFFQFPGAEVHPSQVLVQMPGLGAGATEFDGFLHLGERLRPVLRIGSRERKISELLHAVGDLLILLQLVVAILILLRLGIIGLLQSARQVVESLRIVRVRLQSQFPMGYRLAGVSLMFEILAQEELRVRIIRLKHQQLFEELAGAGEIVILLRGEGEEIKRRRIVGIKAYGLLKLLSRVFILGGFEIEAAQVVVNGGGLRREACGLLKFLEPAGAVVLIQQCNTQVQMHVRRVGLESDDLAETLNSFGASPGLALDHAERRVSCRIAGVNLDGRAQLLFAAGDLAVLGEEQAEIYEGFDVLRIAINRLLVERCRFLILALTAIKDAEIVLRLCITRIAGDRFLEFLFSFGGPVTLESQHTQLIVSDGEFRIELDRFFEFLLFRGAITELIQRERQVVVQLWILRVGA